MMDPVVTRLNVTPVKGLRMQHPDEIVVDETGAVGDRDFILVGEDDKVVTVTTLGALVHMRAEWDPDEGRLLVEADDGETHVGTIDVGDQVLVDWFGRKTRPGRIVAGPWSALISRVAGRPLRLVKMDQPGDGSDVKPVTLLGEGSVRRLEQESGLGPIDPRRFRMLIQFTSDEGHIEDAWEGKDLRIGAARLRVGGSVPRCAAVTRDPFEGNRDKPIVKAIKAYRGVCPTGFGNGVPFGVYADVLQAGSVRVGDRVRLET
jgi:uncharacterized protein